MEQRTVQMFPSVNQQGRREVKQMIFIVQKLRQVRQTNNTE